MWVTPFCSWLLCGLDKLLEPGPDTATGVVHCCDAQAELRGDTLARLSLDGCAPERLPRVIADLRANPTRATAPLAVHFDATHSTDPDFNDTINNYSFHFGDGTPDVSGGNPIVDHTNAALARVTMPTLLLASASDRLIGIDGARRIRDGIARPTYAEIPSDLGHRAMRAVPGTPEGDFVARRIRDFLAILPDPPAD